MIEKDARSLFFSVQIIIIGHTPAFFFSPPVIGSSLKLSPRGRLNNCHSTMHSRLLGVFPPPALAHPANNGGKEIFNAWAINSLSIQSRRIVGRMERRRKNHTLKFLSPISISHNTKGISNLHNSLILPLPWYRRSAIPSLQLSLPSRRIPFVFLSLSPWYVFDSHLAPLEPQQCNSHAKVEEISIR